MGTQYIFPGNLDSIHFRGLQHVSESQMSISGKGDAWKRGRAE